MQTPSPRGPTHYDDSPAPPGGRAREPAGRRSLDGPPRSARLTIARDVVTIAFGDEQAHLRRTRGLELLARLLAHPGERIHVLELATCAVPGDAGALLDARAKQEYRRRYRDLVEEVEEAERFHDDERAAALRAEMRALTGELSRAVGLGGRDRRAASAVERARVRVAVALRRALRRIGEKHPALAEHLVGRVRTGVLCSYEPDPIAGVRWGVDGDL